MIVAWYETFKFIICCFQTDPGSSCAGSDSNYSATVDSFGVSLAGRSTSVFMEPNKQQEINGKRVFIQGTRQFDRVEDFFSRNLYQTPTRLASGSWYLWMQTTTPQSYIGLPSAINSATNGLTIIHFMKNSNSVFLFIALLQ